MCARVCLLVSVVYVRVCVCMLCVSAVCVHVCVCMRRGSENLRYVLHVYVTLRISVYVKRLSVHVFGLSSKCIISENTLSSSKHLLLSLPLITGRLRLSVHQKRFICAMA